jgi:hypothetical protein
MAYRPPSIASLHSRMVYDQAMELTRLGYVDVRADDIGWPGGTPAMIGGHVPDVTARGRRGLLVVEVETCDTITLAQTRSQWTAFSSTPGTFRVLVPTSCLAAAKRQAYLWRIRVDEWWQQLAA